MLKNASQSLLSLKEQPDQSQSQLENLQMQPTMFCDQSTTLIKDPETFDYTQESKKKKKDHN